MCPVPEDRSGEGARHLAEHVEKLFGELEAQADPHVRDLALDLLGTVMRMHREALETIIGFAKSLHSPEEILAAMSDDPLVSTLLMSHSLLPATLEERVQTALDQVRGYQHMHGGDAELLGVEDGVVKLRLLGACHGCGSSLITLRAGIEKAIKDAVPEIVDIQVEGLLQTTSASINVDQIGARRKGWRAVPDYEEVPFGAMRAFEVDGESVLFCRAFGSIYAFRNVCPEGGGPLQEGTLEGFVLRCPCHGHAFDIRSGRGVDRPDLTLQPLPTGWDKGHLRVAV